MIVEGLEVIHKTFGKGVVVSLNGKYITVKFDSCQKIFVYPDAFENFLTLADGTVPDEILEHVYASKAAKQIIIDKKQEENRRAMERGIVIPGKEGAIGESEDEDGHYKNQDNEEN
jgi:hypothetical protein